MICIISQPLRKYFYRLHDDDNSTLSYTKCNLLCCLDPVSILFSKFPAVTNCREGTTAAAGAEAYKVFDRTMARFADKYPKAMHNLAKDAVAQAAWL